MLACHHPVWTVYRVACLCLDLSSHGVDGLQGGVSELESVITHCGWFTGWRVCACTCHHPLWMVYRVVCLCLHLSSPSVDGLQGCVSVLACYHPLWMVYRVVCLCLHVITNCGWFTGWRVCVCICHHPVLIVYRAACLCLHVITHCGWFIWWLIVCASMSSPTVDGLQGG